MKSYMRLLLFLTSIEKFVPGHSIDPVEDSSELVEQSDRLVSRRQAMQHSH